MASPASCAQYSSLVAAVRVSTAPRRRPASSSFSRVHIPPAARTPPRSLSVSLSVLRPRARGASDRESAGDDAGFGFPPCDPAVEDPCNIIATTNLHVSAVADDAFGLQVPIVEDPFEGGHDKGGADLVPRPLFVEGPYDLVATTGLDEGVPGPSEGDAVLRFPAEEEPHEVTALVAHELTTTTDLCVVARDDAGLVLHVPTVEEPQEVTALVLRELTATSDLCVVARDDAGLVLDVPIIEAPHEGAATTGLGDGAHVNSNPTSITEKDLDEYETTDFSRAAINERFRLESKEAKAAVTGAVVGVISPLRQLVDDMRSLRSVFDAEEFQIGMTFAAIMTCMGMYQLWKLSPSTCMDVAMYYAFYKLSAIAADIRRRGFSPDWIIRIKLGIIITVLAKEHYIKGVAPLHFIRVAIFFIYALSVCWELIGVKKYASKCFLHILFHVLSGGNYFTEETGESQVKPMV